MIFCNFYFSEKISKIRNICNTMTVTEYFCIPNSIEERYKK